MEINLNVNDTNDTVNTKLPIASLICSWFNLTVLVIPAILVSTFTLVNCIFDYKLSKSVQIGLSNILIGNLIIAISGLMEHLFVIVSAYNGVSNIPNTCRFFTWIFFIGQISRLSFIPLLAVAVYMLTRYGEPTITRKGRVSVFAITRMMWVCTIPFSALSFSPQVISIYLIQGVLCYPLLNKTPFGYVSAVVYLSVFGLFSYLLTIGSGIAGVRYVKSNTISDSKVLRAATKFKFFLYTNWEHSKSSRYIIPVISGSLDIKEDVSLYSYHNSIYCVRISLFFFVSHSNNNLIVPQTN